VSGSWTPYVVESLEPDPELLPGPEPEPAADRLGTDGTSTTAPGDGTGHRHHGTGTEGTGRAPGTGSADGTGTEVVPVPVQRAGTGTLALLWLREHAARAAENQRRHRTFWHWTWAGLVSRAETLAEHRDYVKSRAWVEDYMTGWVRDFIEWENVLYGIFVARTMKFICQSTDKIFERQLRFWIAVGMFLAGLAIWHLTH
jgi:hypothetical protein